MRSIIFGLFAILSLNLVMVLNKLVLQVAFIQIGSIPMAFEKRPQSGSILTVQINNKWEG